MIPASRIGYFDGDGKSDLSIGASDPWVRLAAGILANAVRDLRDPDPVKSLDALAFWLDESRGPAWLDLLGFPLTADPLEKIVRAPKDARKRKLD